MPYRITIRSICVITAIIALSSLPSVHGSGILRVDDDVACGGDGMSWTSAYSCLQDALAFAAAPTNDICEIRVAQGIYFPDRSLASPTPTGLRSDTFQLLDGVALRGGFRGGATNADDRDVDVFVTILSGDLDENDTGAADDASHDLNSYHVVVGSGVTSSSVLDGFTITGGRASGFSPDDRGAGILIENGSPSITACTIVGNAADSLGGGVYHQDGSTVLTSCQFRENLGGGGGGLYTRGGTPTITNCDFADNDGGSNGGGIYAALSGAPVVIGSRFEGNSASTGGAVHSFETLPTIIGCEFIDNTASVKGGGVRIRKTGKVYNSLFVGNSASLGGAIQADLTSGTQEIVNCTFVGNTATTSGGAVISENNSYFTTGFTRIWNCIVSGNSVPQVAPVARLTVSASNVEGGFGGGNIDSDPLFVNPSIGDYRLQLGSPSVDAGLTSLLPSDTLDLDGDADVSEPIPFDLDGNLRIVDRDGGGDTIDTVDQGAFELEPNQPPDVAIIVAELVTVGAEALITLEADASDPEGASLTLEWLIDGNSVCLEPGDSCGLIDEFLEYGVHEITLRASDPLGAVGEDTATIPIDPSDLSVLDVEHAKVKFGSTPPKFDLKGAVGLPIGVDFPELEPFVMVGLDVAGVGVLPVPVVPVILEVTGSDQKKWKFRDHDGLLGLTHVDIDWKGARFRFKDFDVELKSQIITSSETVLTFKYKMSEIGGAFSLLVDGREILVDALGNASTSASDVAIEVENPGKEVSLTLGFRLLADSVVEFTGAVSEFVDVPEAYDVSVGRFRIKGALDEALFPAGAATDPRSLDLFLFVGAEGYPGEVSLFPGDLEEKSHEWKK